MKTNQLIGIAIFVAGLISLNGLALYNGFQVKSATGVVAAEYRKILLKELPPARQQHLLSLIEKRDRAIANSSRLAATTLFIDLVLATWLAQSLLRRARLEQLVEQRTKELQEALEFKSRFVATISHQYRTPLTAIASGAEILAYPRITPAKKALHIERIQKSVRRMTKLLDEVLFLENPSLEATSTEVINIRDFIQRIIEEMRDRFPDCAIEADYQCPDTGRLNAIHLEAILENLLSNAIKYSPLGATVSLSAQYSGEAWVFTVEDKGIGIPTEDQPYLFEPFRRASNSGSISGSGLGLAIVKRAVEACGGEIAFKSDLGVGTTFVVKLPATDK